MKQLLKTLRHLAAAVASLASFSYEQRDNTHRGCRKLLPSGARIRRPRSLAPAPSAFPVPGNHCETPGQRTLQRHKGRSTTAAPVSSFARDRAVALFPTSGRTLASVLLDWLPKVISRSLNGSTRCASQRRAPERGSATRSLRHSVGIRKLLLANALALVFAAATSASGETFHVTTLTGPIPNVLNICAEKITLTTTITTDTGAGGFVDQTLPTGWTLDTIVSQTGGSVGTFSTGPTVLRYTVFGSSCTITITVKPNTSCNATPQLLSINYSVTTGNTLAPPANYLVQQIKPDVHLDNFRDDAQQKIVKQTAQELLIAPKQHRYFDVSVAVGSIGGFKITYNPESEIAANGTTLTMKGEHAGTVNPTVVSLPLTVGPATHDITPTLMAMLFPASGGIMVAGDRIHFTETFAVTQCSPTPQNDATVFGLTWYCPGAANILCNTEFPVVERSILVRESTSRIAPGIRFENPPGTAVDLDFCPGMPSDILVSFANPGPDTSSTFPGPFPIGADKKVPARTRRAPVNSHFNSTRIHSIISRLTMGSLIPLRKYTWKEASPTPTAVAGSHQRPF